MDVGFRASSQPTFFKMIYLAINEKWYKIFKQENIITLNSGRLFAILPNIANFQYAKEATRK